MGFWKNLLYSGMIAYLLGTSTCTLRSPTMLTNRTVTANQTMFANTGVNYTLSSPDGTKIEYKRPCDSSYTANSVVPMDDNCYGTLETKVDGAEGSKIYIHKGEAMTDSELESYIDSIKNPSSTDPREIKGVNYNVPFSGYNWDAICSRGAVGSGVSQNFFVVRIGNNNEESQIASMIAAAYPEDIIVINPTDDEDTKIQTYLNQF